MSFGSIHSIREFVLDIHYTRLIYSSRLISSETQDLKQLILKVKHECYVSDSNVAVYVLKLHKARHSNSSTFSFMFDKSCSLDTFKCRAYHKEMLSPQQLI